MIKILIVGCLLAIIASLSSGLFYFMRDKGESQRMVHALTVRIALSVLLFGLLFVAWMNGMLHPHGFSQ